MTFEREINQNSLPYIWLDSLYFLRTILRHFEGYKNKLVELYNKTTIVAQGGIPGPEKDLLNLIQWQYLWFCWYEKQDWI